MLLQTYELNKIEHLTTPGEVFEMTLNSPAIDIFTDFTKTEPLVIDGALDIVTAEYLMKKTHVKLKLVLEDGKFVGTLAYTDLIGEKVIALVHHTPRRNILVWELMTPRDKLRAIDFSDLKKANVRDIVETLKNQGTQHILIIDNVLGHIRGIISVSDIARRLHIPINITTHSTFMDIYKALAHN